MDYRCYCFSCVRCIRRLFRLCYVLQEEKAMATYFVAPCGQGSHAKMQVRIHWEAMATYFVSPCGQGSHAKMQVRIHWEAMATFVVAPCEQGNHAKMKVKDSLGGNGNVCCCALRGLALLWGYGCCVLSCAGHLLGLRKLHSWGHGVSLIREDFSSTQPKGKTDCT